MAAKSVDDKPDHSNAYIDALVGDGWHWSGTITYFFDDDTAAWTAAEKAAYRSALQSWANVANLNFQEVFVESEANLVEHSVSDFTLPGALADHATPMDARKTHVVEGQFNYQRYSIQTTETPEYNATGLVKGGFGYETFVHELGHALGLLHPHDTEDGSGLFPGVTLDKTNDLGDNNLNQVIYSVMSYNEYDQVNGNSSYGYVAGPMAYDIAAIQFLYGAKSANTGSDTYWLPDTNGVGTYWTCIWDTSGVDAIAYGGNGRATIDLRAATLDNSATGGGMLNYVTDAVTGKAIHGGYTIANGVVIENASGGANDDIIRGNNAGQHPQRQQRQRPAGGLRRQRRARPGSWRRRHVWRQRHRHHHCGRRRRHHRRRQRLRHRGLLALLDRRDHRHDHRQGRRRLGDRRHAGRHREDHRHRL